jgi:hypothetical protein
MISQRDEIFVENIDVYTAKLQRSDIEKCVAPLELLFMR